MTADGGCEDSRFCSPHSWSCPGSPSTGATSGTCTQHAQHVTPPDTAAAHSGPMSHITVAPPTSSQSAATILQSAVTADDLMEGH